MAWYRWKPYVSAAKRRQTAKRKMDALRKKGVEIKPIEIEGRTIAKTFWGKSWCDHLESFGDYSNRLPRGRTYVRNGSVCHLAIKEGMISAKVSGSRMYDVDVRIKTLTAKKWEAVKNRCAGQVGSLLELLRGDLSDNIMQVVTNRQQGLFPLSGEISFDCSCPDWATMCKHVAAVLYGVGARLDEDPALLFRLRGVDHEELIEADAQFSVPAASRRRGVKRLSANELGDVFGIDLEADPPGTPAGNSRRSKSTKKKKTTAKKKKTPAAKRKSPSKSTAAKQKKKVASAKKKKLTKVLKKTTGRKLTKKKAAVKTVTAKKKKQVTGKKSATKKTAHKKSTKKLWGMAQPVS